MKKEELNILRTIENILFMMELTLQQMESQKKNTLNSFLNSFFFEKRNRGEINLFSSRSRLEFVKIKFS